MAKGGITPGSYDKSMVLPNPSPASTGGYGQAPHSITGSGNKGASGGSPPGDHRSFSSSAGTQPHTSLALRCALTGELISIVRVNYSEILPPAFQIRHLKKV